MPKLTWSDALATGVEPIDAHNQSFLFVLNNLFASGVECEEGSRTCPKLEQTHRFLSRSFAREEALMAASTYAERSLHQGEHAALLTELQRMRRTYECGCYDVFAVFSFMAGWILAHIQTWDKPLGEHLCLRLRAVGKVVLEQNTRILKPP